jgi:hypothetical protein
MLDLTLPSLLAESSLPFRDGPQAKEWLAQLPLTNTTQAHEALLEVVDRLNLASQPAYERLKILEVLREPVAFLQEARGKSFAGHALPLTVQEKRAREHVTGLWAAMRKGYRYCLAGALRGDPEAMKYVPLLVARGLRYAGLQILNYGLAKQVVDERLWRELHDWYAFAETHGNTGHEVRDSLYGYKRLSTPLAAYVRALLLVAAEPYRLTPAELLACDALTAWAATKVSLSTSQPAAGTVRTVQLGGAEGLQARGARREDDASLRYIDLTPLGESLQRRIRKLAGGAKLAELRLPPAFTQVDALALLRRLHSAWCEAPASEFLQRTGTAFCEVVLDLTQLHEHAAGRPFAQPDTPVELSRLDMERIAALGHAPRSANGADLPKPERWALLGESADTLRICRPSAATGQLSLNQLIGVRAVGDKEFQPAVIRSLVDRAGQGIVADVVALPGRGAPVAFRPLAPTDASKSFVPGLTLRDRRETQPATLLLPSRAFQPGRGVELLAPQPHKARLTTLIERGTNFDWVNCEVE